MEGLRGQGEDNSPLLWRDVKDASAALQVTGLPVSFLSLTCLAHCYAGGGALHFVYLGQAKESGLHLRHCKPTLPRWPPAPATIPAPRGNAAAESPTLPQLWDGERLGLGEHLQFCSKAFLHE